MSASEKTSVSIIIPAYNEEKSVGPQVEAIRKVLITSGVTHEIVVIDDGSMDQTAERAIERGARVIKQPENQGYGAALKTGIIAARYETILIIDADGTYPAGQIPQMLTKLEDADMVVGARTGNDVEIPLLRRPAKWILGWLANLISGRSIPDLNSGMRAFRSDYVKQYFSILPNRFSFTTTITLAMLGDNYRVVYHPIDYYRRVGSSKITPWDFMDFVMLVLRVSMLFQPLKVFLPLALFCGALGMLKALFDIVLLSQRVSTFGWAPLLYQPILSPTSILLMLVGLQLLLIGMVADALIRRIARQGIVLKPSQVIYNSHSEPEAKAKEKDFVIKN